MTNAELIKVLKACANDCDCAKCPFGKYELCPSTLSMMRIAADALEAADKRIAIVEEERDLERFAAKNYLDKIDELKARIAELEAQAAFFDAEKLNYQENIEYRDERIKELEAQLPKEGEWVPVTNGRGGHECNLCHGYAPSYKNGDEHLSNYCPNCGAIMKTVTDCHTFEESER